MSDDAKLGLVAGVLAVIGVALFGLPRDAAKVPEAPTANVAATPGVAPHVPVVSTPVSLSR